MQDETDFRHDCVELWNREETWFRFMYLGVKSHSRLEAHAL